MSGERPITSPHPGGRQAAPGELARVQEFLNTSWDLREEGRGETFTSPDALRRWLTDQGLLARGQRLDEDDLRRALGVRRGLRALAFASNGEPLDKEAVESLQDAAAGVWPQFRIGAAGPELVAAADSGLDAALSELLAIAGRAMVAGEWARLKACPGRHCGWAFYDRSRNGSARWCSMKVCGDRAKARAYYRRSRRPAA